MFLHPRNSKKSHIIVTNEWDWAMDFWSMMNWNHGHIQLKTFIPGTLAILLYLHDPPSPSTISHNLTCSYPPSWYNSIGTDLPPGKNTQAKSLERLRLVYYRAFFVTFEHPTEELLHVSREFTTHDLKVNGNKPTVNALSCSWLRNSTWFLELACATATNTTSTQSEYSQV